MFVTMFVAMLVAMFLSMPMTIIMSMTMVMPMTMTMAVTQQKDHDKVYEKPKCCNNKHKHAINFPTFVNNSVNSLIDKNPSNKPNKLYGHKCT